MAEKIIELRRVSWVRKERTILSEIDWTVAEGEHWAIFGLNGSGKTTLLNLINGYIWPSTGSVRVLGKPFGGMDLREMRKSIGWVSSHLQEQLPPGETGLRIVLSGSDASLGLYRVASEGEEQKATMLMERLGCGHLADRPYRICSQGEKQRLLICRALMASPRILILDEPCNGLDLIARERLLADLQELAGQQHLTLLYVTHYVEEILPCFEHVLLLSEGKIFASGRTEEIIRSEVMSRFFGIAVEVEWHRQRPWITLR